jgi:hypothetical protein
MKLSALSILLAGSIILISCTHEEEIVRQVPDGNVNFSDLTDGQQSRYLRYTTTCSNLSPDFTFTGDTLIVETVLTDEGFKLKESLTTGSPSYTGNSAMFRIVKENDDVLIPERSSSALLFFYGNDTIHLNPAHKVSLLQSNCKLMLSGQTFTGDEIGQIESFRIGPLKQIDKTAISCVPLFFQLDAYLLYDENYLYMSHTVSIEDESTVNGWILNY